MNCELQNYTSLLKAGYRVVRQTPVRLLWKFAWNFGMRNLINMSRFERRMAKGEPFFPAFNMISVTETCNLACSGCWVSRNGRKSLTPKQIDGIIEGSKSQGSYFFGILGGEPLMYKGLMEVMERHNDCYFQIFTNATLLTDEIAMRFRKMGNVTVLISVEGLEEESDRRRGRNDVYERTLNGIRACRKAGLIFGVAASICHSNIDELMTREHIERVAKEGAAYLWYYIYRPVGADANPDNALNEEEVTRFRKFLVEQRRNSPVVLIDTYWDDKGKAMCPGATGMSHHISPSGALEFCPPLQLAKEFINEDGSNVVSLYQNSTFLERLRKMTAETSRGCILMDNPQKLVEFLETEGAVETTSRATVMDEYKMMGYKPGHDMKENAIPEKNPLYKLLKKKYFFGFGAYG